jgi:hypothetical protein
VYHEDGPENRYGTVFQKKHSMIFRESENIIRIEAKQGMTGESFHLPSIIRKYRLRTGGRTEDPHAHIARSLYYLSDGSPGSSRIHAAAKDKAIIMMGAVIADEFR